MADKSLGQVLFVGSVINNKDPMGLGRVRVQPSDQNQINALEGWKFKPGDEWTERDPYVFLPLIPLFFNQVPLENERVSLIFQNPQERFQDRYYIQGMFTSMMSLPFENEIAAGTYTTLGYRIKSTIPLKDKTTGEWIDPTSSFGVFPDLGDVALLGRGKSDIIIREGTQGLDTVLIRSGKTKFLDKRDKPVANLDRAYVQVSSFNSIPIAGPIQTIIKLETKILDTKMMVEWNIYNPDNPQKIFNGDITLYSLRSSNLITTNVINYDSDLETSKFLLVTKKFFSLNLNDTITTINKFIKDVNDSNSIEGFQVKDQFPFIYRPNANIRIQISAGDSNINPTTFSNISSIISKITLNPGSGTDSYYFGLVSSKDFIGQPKSIGLDKLKPVNNEEIFGTFIMASANNIVLSSPKSNNPITYSPSLSPYPNTMMGITQEQFTQNVLPSTFSTVRGERLVDYLNRLEKFVLSHVHPYHGYPPDDVALNGSRAEDLGIIKYKVLNENIRIN
jgi:hypothetical protein